MRFLRSLAIGQKLVAITLVTSGVALLIACATFAVAEHRLFRTKMAEDLVILADMIDENVASGLAFGDSASLQTILASLSENERIQAAGVYDAEGRRIASYERVDLRDRVFFPPAEPTAQRFTPERLDTFKTIDLAGERIGTVYLGADLRELRERAWRYLGIVGLLLGVCLLVAFLVASRLQRVISGPLGELAATAGRVAAERDFGVRALKHGDDEIGRLVDGFNHMLAQIQAQDQELRAGREHLEQRVIERTAALQVEIAERRDAQQALVRSHALINATLESTLDGIVVADCDGNPRHFNRRFVEMWGATASALTSGRNRAVLSFVVRRLKNPRAFVRLALRLSADPLAEEAGIVEFLDGRVLELYTRPQHNDGTNTGRVWCFRDVTDRKRAEAEIRHERDLLQTLMDSLPDMLYFKDRQSRFVRLSRSKARHSLLFLRERHDGVHGGPGQVPYPSHLVDVEAVQRWMQGRTDAEVFDPEVAAPLLAEEDVVVRSGAPIQDKMELLRLPAGAEHWFLVTKMPWRDADGGIIGTYGVSKDITAIKEAEAKLALVHQQLVDTSRQAGMAEVATGVLHNVGNVLNSVNVSVNVVRDKLERSEMITLGRVAELLRGRSSDLGAYLTSDPKGKLIPPFVISLADQLATEHQLLRTEHEHLSRNVEHIKQIVAMQQNYARVSGVREQVVLTELVGDALQINLAGLTRHQIEVVREFQPLRTAIVEKHKVLQILVNMIQNAKHALSEREHLHRRITLSLAGVGEDRFTISVSDNGVGIPRENLTRIFSHGFTTRKHGHGFGLHSGAIAAREMGGALRATSAGPGQGSTFILELPFQREDRP